MSDIYKGELQDNQGNTIYPHTEADVVFCSDGKTMQDKITEVEKTTEGVTGRTDSLEVNDSSILATSKTTYQLAQNQGGCALSYEDGNFYIQAGADTGSKKKLGSGTIYKLGTGRSFSIADIVGEENVANYSINNFLVVWDSPSCEQQQLGWNGETDNRVFTYAKIVEDTDFVKSYDNTTGTITITGGTYKLGAWATQVMSGYNYATIEATPIVYFLDSVEILSVDAS